jgi:hypothetical protein
MPKCHKPCRAAKASASRASSWARSTSDKVTLPRSQKRGLPQGSQALTNGTGPSSSP